MYCGAPLGGLAVGAVAPIAPAPPVVAHDGAAPASLPRTRGPDGARLCPGCGHPARGRVLRCLYCGQQLPPIDRPPERLCPRCLETMQVLSASWVSVDACQRCGGVFYDRGELERAHRLSPEQMEWLLGKLTPVLSEQGSAAPLICPGCRRSMRALTTGDVQPVVIDACPACKGVWLDRCEAELLYQMAIRRRASRPGAYQEREPVALDPSLQAELARQAQHRGRARRAREGLLPDLDDDAIDLLSDVLDALL